MKVHDYNNFAIFIFVCKFLFFQVFLKLSKTLHFEANIRIGITFIFSF